MSNALRNGLVTPLEQIQIQIQIQTKEASTGVLPLDRTTRGK